MPLRGYEVLYLRSDLEVTEHEMESTLKGDQVDLCLSPSSLPLAACLLAASLRTPKYMVSRILESAK